MDVTLSDFIPFFKMFPGIYQVINERLIEEIESYPFWSDLERLVKNSFKDAIDDSHSFLLLVEEELFKYIEKKDDKFLREIKKIDIPQEILIDDRENVSIRISVCSFSDVDLIREIKNGGEFYIVDKSIKKRIRLVDLVGQIDLVIKNNKDGLNVKYILSPKSCSASYVKEIDQHGNYVRSFYPCISDWENMHVLYLKTFQGNGDSWKIVNFYTDRIAVEIKKGTLYFRVPYRFSSENNSVYTEFSEFRAEIIKNLPERSDSPSSLFYFDNFYVSSSLVKVRVIVFLNKDKAKFFTRVSSEDVRSNENIRKIGIFDEGIYVTEKPVSFRLFHSPELTQYSYPVSWYLMIEKISWEKVDFIPPDAFEIKALESVTTRTRDEGGKPLHPVEFFVDKETLPKLPFHPEIFGTNNYTENRKAYKRMIRGYERRKLY